MRKSLVTQFVCSNCGDYLSLSYDRTNHPSNSLEGEDYSITGACKVDNVIAVNPCERCYGEVRMPMEALSKIIKAAIGMEFGIVHNCHSGSSLDFMADTRQEVMDEWNTRAISADEKEQLRRLKAFVNDVFDDLESFRRIDPDDIEGYSRDHGLGGYEKNKGFVKADWLKDENDQPQP